MRELNSNIARTISNPAFVYALAYSLIFIKSSFVDEENLHFIRGGARVYLFLFLEFNFGTWLFVDGKHPFGDGR